MKNTTFVGAGAGSGKTYRLTQDIASMIEKGECGAEEIILTTFTEVAAQELKEKVRATLYSKGLYDAAKNIDSAAIGTIHSIAYQFVSRYWYLLGISANASIMDNTASQFFKSQSIALLPSDEDVAFFEKVLKSFNVTKKVEGGKTVDDPDFWRLELETLIDKTIELCISEDDLKKAKEESLNLLEEVMGFKDSFDIKDEKIFKFRQFTEAILADEALPKTNRGKIELKMPTVRTYEGSAIDVMPLIAIFRLASEVADVKNKTINKNHSEGIASAFELIEQIPSSVQVKSLIEKYVDTIFSLAIKWKQEYEAFKKERCILDFGDLLQYFDKLLNHPEVEEEIKSRYKVVFVDEYQDCSPLQVKSFNRLSELMEKSVWVGDIKQAIYGFRGTNTELIKKVISEVKKKEEGNEQDTLEHCWRSNETIINLVNEIFCNKVFTDLDKNLVELTLPERKETDPVKPEEKALIHWHFKEGSKKNSPEGLAQRLQEFIESGVYKTNEIAILYDGNKKIDDLVECLQKYGIPYNVKKDDGKNKGEGDEISIFINAVVSFVANERNELSKAIVINRIMQGYNASKIISDRMRYIDNEEADGEKKGVWLSEFDIIRDFNRIRKVVSNQSVASAIETIIVELNLLDLIKRISPDTPTYNYCASLSAKASTYEGMCSSLSLNSTLVGFAEYLKGHPVSNPGDDNGVTVLTYHKSKGLEWPCVILCSLNRTVKDTTFYGVVTLNTAESVMLRLFPSALHDLCKQKSITDFEFFKQKNKSEIEEMKRIMYVGMTRAKEQLIHTTYGGDKCATWLETIGCEKVDLSSKNDKIIWSEAEWTHEYIEVGVGEQTESDTDSSSTEEEKVYFNVLKTAEENVEYKDKFVSPSKVKPQEGVYQIKGYDKFAERLTIKAIDRDDSTIGDFFHHAMCLYSGDSELITSLAASYGINAEIDDIVNSINTFWQMLEVKYGKATEILRETPFCYTNNEGQVITGEIDLIYRTTEGDVLVDYKTYQGEISKLIDSNSEFYAGKYCGQISLYEEALTRKGYKVRDRLISYMSLGVTVKFHPI